MFAKKGKLILITIAITLFFPTQLSAINKSDVLNVEQQKEEGQKRFEPTSNEYNIVPIDAEKSFTNDIMTFKFSSSEIIDRVTSDNEIKIDRFNQDKDNIVYCTLSNYKDNSKVSLSFYKNNNLIDKCAIYFVKDLNGTIYSSSISFDVAKRAAGKKLNYNLAKEEEKNNNYDLPNISTCEIGASGEIYGYLKWQDEQGKEHPLIGAKVKATMSMSWWNQETYTDMNGYYKISYHDIWHVFGGLPTIHVYAENNNVRVCSGGRTYEKSYEFSSGSGGEFSYTFSPNDDGDMGKAMMIFQGAKNFSDYATSLNGGAPIDYCNFEYPYGNDGCSYSNGTVYITGEGKKYPHLPESYASWDVIGHEYGHHVQRFFGLSESPGGTHAIDSNNIDDQFNSGYSLEEAKNRGHKLSWGEGWPTYWSMVAQTHFDDDVKKIYTVGDTRYTSYNGVDYDVDTYGYGHGDADEQAIQRFIYKLYDSEIDDYDKFAVGETELWNIVRTNKPHTFSEFIEDLYNANYNKHNLGLLLDRYNMISGKITSDNYQYFDALPTFTWSSAMGSSNLRFNQFDLCFVNSSGSLIKAIKDISCNSYNISYTLYTNEWQDIYKAGGDTFGVYFVARQTLSYVSGNYYSEVTTFNKPSTFKAGKVQIKPNEWGFEGRYYFANEIEDIKSIDEDINNVRFKSITKDGLTISTDRLRCGYIEDLYVNLSPRRNNAGYAYLEMNFNKPIYSILYCVGLWNGYELLDGDALIKVKDALGNWNQIVDLHKLNLKTKSKGFLRYYEYFQGGIYGLRFECNATATGNRNRGRLSIDDIVFGTKTSISENTYYITNYGKTKP